MVKRWILYLLGTAGCIAFFVGYQGWVAWVLMVLVAALPLLSLAVSLIPMLCTRPRADIPTVVTMGAQETLYVTIGNTIPSPPCRCQYRVRHSFTGESRRVNAGEALPTKHCGKIVCDQARFYVYDYLGMFRLRKKLEPVQVIVRPVEIPMEVPLQLQRQTAHSWQPKYGGGFAEQHELRLYRPGDGLNQVHWKLSAKTGKLIIREPMVPRQGLNLLTLDLSGTPWQLDRKLGQLMGLAEQLLQMQLRFEIYALTGNGPVSIPVATREELIRAVDLLLAAPVAVDGSIADHGRIASWQCHIGGDADES